jgi:hypothetical protein
LIQTGESFGRRPSIGTLGCRCVGCIEVQETMCVVLDTIKNTIEARYE